MSDNIYMVLLMTFVFQIILVQCYFQQQFPTDFSIFYLSFWNDVVDAISINVLMIFIINFLDLITLSNSLQLLFAGTCIVVLLSNVFYCISKNMISVYISFLIVFKIQNMSRDTYDEHYSQSKNKENLISIFS